MENLNFLMDYAAHLSTRELGRAPEFFDEIDSTNAYCKRRIAAGDVPAGLCAVALQQSSGRGRLGRTWESAPGAGLYLTLAAPAMPGELLLLLPVAVGVAAAEAIEALCGVTVGVKWPNDLIVRDRKLAGILCEAVNSRAVCGIGVNLRQDADFFARANLPHGTSLAIETGDAPPLGALAAEIANRLEPWCDRLLAGRTAELLAAFRPRCISLGREVRAISADGEHAGTAVDVDDAGRLVIETAAERIAVSAGEVQLRTARGYL